jgi:hypothetical protein
MAQSQGENLSGGCMKSLVWTAIFQVSFATCLICLPDVAKATEPILIAQEDVLGADTVEPSKKKKKKKKKKDQDATQESSDVDVKKDTASETAKEPQVENKDEASGKPEPRKKSDDKKKADPATAVEAPTRTGNPVVSSHAGFGISESRSLLVFLDSDESAQGNAIGFGLSLHLPPAAAVTYLNAFGIFVGFESFSRLKKSIFYQSNSEPDQLVISGSDFSGGMIYRASSLVSGIIDGLGMKIGYQKFSEKMTFTSATGRSDATYEYTVSGPVVTLLMDVMPVRNVLLGTQVTPPIPQTAKMVTKSDSLNEDAAGTWSGTRLKLYAGFKYVATMGLLIEGTGGVTYRSDKIETKQVSVAGERNTSSVTPFGTFSVGFVLNP